MSKTVLYGGKVLFLARGYKYVDTNPKNTISKILLLHSGTENTTKTDKWNWQKV